jgi:hypothetical protein
MTNSLIAILNLKNWLFAHLIRLFVKKTKRVSF